MIRLTAPAQSRRLAGLAANWRSFHAFDHPTSLTVSEGGSNTYTVQLATEPTGPMNVGIGTEPRGSPNVPAGSDLTVDKRGLEFKVSNWNIPQTVTVTAGEDADTVDDMATLMHWAVVGGYGDVEADLAVTVTDDDTPGLVFSPTSLDVNEGDDASYTVKLATQPTGTVTVAISGQSGTDLTLDATSLEFTTSTRDDAQTVTVTAGEDPDLTDDTATLTHAASGGGYSVTADLAVTVTDDDQLPVVSFASSSSSAGEAAGTRDVTVDPSPSPPAAITVTYTVGGTATVGSDFSISGSGTLSVASGVTTATVPVAITDDTAEEQRDGRPDADGGQRLHGGEREHPYPDDYGRRRHGATAKTDPNCEPVGLSEPGAEGGTVTARLSEALSGSVTSTSALVTSETTPRQRPPRGCVFPCQTGLLVSVAAFSARDFLQPSWSVLRRRGRVTVRRGFLRPPMSAEAVARMVELRARGLGFGRIARAIGCARITVSRYLRSFEEESW